MIKVYTDGACKGNPGLGGWGVVLLGASGLERYANQAPIPATTNNAMELTAFLKGLTALKKGGYVAAEIITDSTYVRDGITKWITGWISNGWRTSSGQPVKNKQLWQDIYDMYKTMDISVSWVKAHNGNKYNEMVDKLASDACAYKE